MVNATQFNVTRCLFEVFDIYGEKVDLGGQCSEVTLLACVGREKATCESENLASLVYHLFVGYLNGKYSMDNVPLRGT